MPHDPTPAAASLARQKLDYQAEFFDALAQHSRDAALVADVDAVIIYISPVVEAMFGYKPEEVLSREGWDFVHPDDMERVRAVFDEVVASGGVATVEFRIMAGDGSWRWVEEVITNLLHTPVGGIVANLIDTTERHRAEDLLLLEQARNRAIVETVQDGLWLVDEDGETVFVNRQMADIAGLPLGQLYERGPTAFLGPREPRLLDSPGDHRVARGREEYDLPYEHPDGSERRLHVVMTPISFGEGDELFHGSLASVVDVTEVRAMEVELRNAALRDQLTGLPNRSLLLDRFEQAVARLERTRSGHLCVMDVDLDQFKMLNASLGHEQADDVLREIGQRLSASVPPDGTVARLGGDEFVLVLLVNTAEAAEDVATQVLEQVARPHQVAGAQVRTGASVGVALSPPQEPRELLQHAETAMNAAKAGGRNRFQIFDDRLAVETAETSGIVNDLVSSFDDGSLRLHYQPIVDLRGGLVIGYEALARWEHPRMGTIPPGRFVPVAERAGLAREFDRWAVERALVDFSRLRAAGIVDEAAHVAINLSAQELGHPDVERFLLDVAERTGVSPANVTFEVTEGAIMYDQREAIRLLESLRGKGFGVALDDFGTGQSSLANLRKLPVSLIKIDRSFIDDMIADSDAWAIVTSVLGMASAIGLPVVAEGVEHQAQAAELRRLGCTAAQGWLWSHARPPEEIKGLPRSYQVATTDTTGGGSSEPAVVVGDEHGRQLILRLHREGASLATIAAALNSEGFRTPSGRRWHGLSVARALTGLAPR